MTDSELVTGDSSATPVPSGVCLYARVFTTLEALPPFVRRLLQRYVACSIRWIEIRHQH